MLQIDSSAAYDKKDLMELFELTARSINRYYENGLPRHCKMGKNYTFGHEIIAWLGEKTEPTLPNPKLLKFKKGHAM